MQKTHIEMVIMVANAASIWCRQWLYTKKHHNKTMVFNYFNVCSTVILCEKSSQMQKKLTESLSLCQISQITLTQCLKINKVVANFPTMPTNSNCIFYKQLSAELQQKANWQHPKLHKMRNKLYINSSVKFVISKSSTHAKSYKASVPDFVSIRTCYNKPDLC